jgi:hypothetical protein
VLTDSTGAVAVSTPLTANGGVVFNDAGADVDFRVEGDTNANLLFVDASTDAIGINTATTTNAKLTILEDFGTTLLLQKGSGAPALAFGSSTTNYALLESINGGGLAFYTGNGTLSERMSILAGGGLTFNGDTATANALDDYEEGTWSATITTTGGSVTIGSQTCTYTKVGRLVVLNGTITLSAISSPTGQFTITNLPFVPGTNSTGGSTIDLQSVASTSATSLYSELSTTPRIYVAKYTELDNLSDAADLLTATTSIRFGATYST